jgi:hypothetical protein
MNYGTKKKKLGQMPMAHICNLRRQRLGDCSSKPALANSSRNPVSNIPNTKKG